MNIFESLENLNVSEECFNDIMGIVEEILSEGYEKPLNYWSHIERVHGKGKYNEATGEPLNKSAELIKKSLKKRSEEIDDAVEREGRDHNDILNKRDTNSRSSGDAMTKIKQMWNRGQMLPRRLRKNS